MNCEEKIRAALNSSEFKGYDLFLLKEKGRSYLSWNYCNMHLMFPISAEKIWLFLGHFEEESGKQVPMDENFYNNHPGLKEPLGSCIYDFKKLFYKVDPSIQCE